MRNARLLIALVHGSALFLLAYGTVWAAGFRVNTTGSLPLGIYKLRSGQPQRGDIVLICPPRGSARETAMQRGYLMPDLGCGGAQSLLKPIAAIGGDRVKLDSGGLSVNGRLLPNSAPLLRDGAGRTMPSALTPLHTVPYGYIWLISTYSARSYDSRYFGRVKQGAVQNIAQAWWTFP